MKHQHAKKKLSLNLDTVVALNLRDVRGGDRISWTLSMVGTCTVETHYNTCESCTSGNTYTC